MRVEDLPAVVAIERATFPSPWSYRNFQHEITRNPFAFNPILLEAGGGLVAYANTWIVDDEMRINNVAVREVSRHKGFGEALMVHLLETGARRGCLYATLEVRPTNAPALGLYRKLGFRVVGRRRGYYSDTGEDALVMRRTLPGPGAGALQKGENGC
jgi:ribosomal-protein-alanine N-acetyltransferase